MSRVDFVFVALGIFCYFATMMELKTATVRAAQFDEINKKKKLYNDHMIEQKHIELLKKQAEERKLKHKVNFKQMASTVEMLSNLSDQEIMRKSKVTSGKF